MRKVIFLHRKFPQSKHQLDLLLNRWNEYGKLLADSNDGYGITIVCFSRPVSLQRSLKARTNIADLDSLKFMFGISSVIKEVSIAKSNYTIVCGDNQLMLLLGLYLRSLYRRSVRLQIQFHGNTYSFFANKGIVGKIRVLISRIGIYFADSIRIVSNFQIREIQRIYPWSKPTFVLAPIPIDFMKIPTERLKQLYDVIIVGRLQQERGTTEMIKIVHDLIGIDSSLKIAIAGLGPDLEIIKERLNLDEPCNSVSLLGHLSSDSLKDLYSHSRVLLSCAPQEGYGLTIREAALSGMHVVAKESKGAREALESYKNSIHLYVTREQAIQHIINLLETQVHVDHENLKELQRELDQKSMLTLVKSWTQT